MKRMRMNKKGISAVVATVLIILITVAAVTIIWAAVIPMIKDQTTGGTVCLDAVSQVSLDTEGGYTCKKTGRAGGKNYVQVKVSHGAKSFDLADVQVLVGEGGTTVPYTLDDDATKSDGVGLAGANVDSDDLPEANEAKLFRINITNDAGGNADPDKVEIAPIVSVGQTEKACEISSTVVLTECA